MGQIKNIKLHIVTDIKLLDVVNQPKMSKKRGLSQEEKRQKMMEIFYETKSFFQLKELEKIAPKEKGITSMSVKDVVQSLVDDAMVDTERIGTSNYFWAYPSKGLNMRKRKHEGLLAQENTLKDKISNNLKLIEQARAGKEESDERSELMARLCELKEESKAVGSELAQYQDCDPDVLDGVKKVGDVALEAANRWTDNLFQVKGWCKTKFNVEESQLNKQFNIPEELDYIDG